MIEAILGFLGGSAFWSILGKFFMQKDQQVFAEKLESTKAELEGVKTALRQYSEGQFDVYRELWGALCELKVAADDLWHAATPELADRFAKKLSSTRLWLEKSSLLLEDEHYGRLVHLFQEFNEFWYGKQQLIELKSQEADSLAELQNRRKTIVERNGYLVEEYSETLQQLRGYFQSHLKGADDDEEEL